MAQWILPRPKNMSSACFLTVFPGPTRKNSGDHKCDHRNFGRSVGIRTRGLLDPNQARYQASPHPETSSIIPGCLRFVNMLCRILPIFPFFLSRSSGAECSGHRSGFPIRRSAPKPPPPCRRGWCPHPWPFPR